MNPRALINCLCERFVRCCGSSDWQLHRVYNKIRRAAKFNFNFNFAFLPTIIFRHGVDYFWRDVGRLCIIVHLFMYRRRAAFKYSSTNLSSFQDHIQSTGRIYEG